MTISTVTGTGSTTCVLLSSGSGVALPQNVATSLLQLASETISVTGSHALLQVRTESTNNNWCQVSLTIDGAEVYNSAAGDKSDLIVPLSLGSHTVTFTAVAFNSSLTMTTCSLIVIDLGI